MAGDILVARSGSVGKSFLVTAVPEPAIFASYLIRLRVRETANPAYVYWCLQTEQFWRQIMKARRGSAMKNINARMLSALRFPLPEMQAQKRVATFLMEASHYFSGENKVAPEIPDVMLVSGRALGILERIAIAERVVRDVAGQLDLLVPAILEQALATNGTDP